VLDRDGLAVRAYRVEKRLMKQGFTLVTEGTIKKMEVLGRF
jgi:hypothetical protein